MKVRDSPNGCLRGLPKQFLKHPDRLGMPIGLDHGFLMWGFLIKWPWVTQPMASHFGVDLATHVPPLLMFIRGVLGFDPQPNRTRIPLFLEDQNRDTKRKIRRTWPSQFSEAQGFQGALLALWLSEWFSAVALRLTNQFVLV